MVRLDRNRTIHRSLRRPFHGKDQGEWFGYLHRDGSVSGSEKDNQFMGLFFGTAGEWIPQDPSGLTARGFYRTGIGLP